MADFYSIDWSSLSNEKPEETPSVLSYEEPEPAEALDTTHSGFSGIDWSSLESDKQETVEPDSNDPYPVIRPPQETEDLAIRKMGVVGSATYGVGKYFAGSGIPTAVSGLTSTYFAMNERIGDLLGLEDFEGYAKAKKEYWDTLRQDFQVEGFESSVIDNPMLLLDPRWYNYQIGKMAPAMAAGAATGGLAGGGAALGSVVTGVTMSAPEAALVFDEVLKEAGDKQAAYASAMYNFAINTTLESFGFSKLLSVTGRPLTRYAKGAVTEGGTEFSQSLLNDIQQTFWTEAAKGSSVPEITEKIRQDFPQMLKESLAAGVAGGAIGGVLGGISPSERNSARQVLRDLGVPEDQLVEPEVEIDPNSEIGKVMSRLDSENSLSSVDIRQTEEVPTATEVLEETPLETLSTEEPATEQGIQQPTETQEAVGQADTEALPIAPDTQAVVEPEIDPRLESVLNPPTQEEVVPDISAAEALDEAIEAEPLGVDREFSIREPEAPISRLDLEMEQAQELPQEEVVETTPQTDEAIRKLEVYFKDKPNAPLSGFVRLLKESGLEGMFRAKLEPILGEEAQSRSLVSLVTRIGHGTTKNLMNIVIQEKKLVDSSVKGLVGVQDTGTTRDIDTPNTPSTYSPLPDPSISISRSSQTYSPQTEGTITEQQGDKITENIFPPEEEPTNFKDDIYRAPTTPEELRLVTDREDKEALRKLDNSQNFKQASAFSTIAKALGIHDQLVRKANRESPVADKNVANLLNRLGVTRVRELMYEALSEHRRDQVIQNRVDKQSVKPTGKPLEQLDQKMEEAHKRAGKKAKKDEPLTEEQRVKAGEKFVAATDKHMETKDPDKEVKESEREKTKRDLGTKAQRAFQESMSILEGIHPRLAGLMKRFEAAVMNNTKERLDRGNVFYKVYKNLNPRERQLMKKAWVNYHKPGARKIIDDYSKQNPEFGKAFAEARAIVDEITGEAMATGIIGKNRKYYLPARVRDLDGLLTFIAEHAKPEKAPVAKELQDVMATSEENPSATSITSMMSEYLGREVKTYEEAKAEFGKLLERGFLPTMFLNPSSGRGRQIWNVTDGMLAFYYDPAESLELHIKEMTEAIEQRKLVGVSRKGKYQDELDALAKKLIKEPQDYDRIRSLQQAIVAEDSMDRLTEDVTDVVTKATIEGGLSIRDQKMAIDVFKDRFNQKRLGKFLAGLKDLSLASALGQGLSTITQIADFAPMVIRQGFWNSVQAMNADKSFRKEEIDTNSANTEWANSSKTSKFLDGLLTGTGFKAMDSFFATASMEAALIKAKKTPWREFNKNYRHIFGKDTKQLFDDIQNGEKTKLAKEFAVIELSETRPLFPTNMPPSFLIGGDARILYALKGWNLKTANNLYRDIRRAQREGGMPRATYVGLKNIAILALAGASAEAIKDLVLGNPVDLEDDVLDSLLKIGFMSRYSLGEFKKGNFDDGFVDYFTPPLNYIKRPWQDIHDAISEDGKFTFETLKEMPAVGRWLHARFTPYGQKARLDKEREAIFGLLKDATLERDQKLMVEFHKKRRAYNEKVRDLKGNGGPKDLKAIDTESISRAKKRYREAENKRR